MHKFCGRFLTAAFVVATFVASSSFAGPARELDRNIGRVLGGLPKSGKATLRNVSLGRESLDTIELEPMEVWAKDAKITAYGPAGEETLVAPPDVAYFKGRVQGEDESAVFFSRSRNGAIRGMVLIGERRWVIGTGVRRGNRPGAAVRKELEIGADNGESPLLVSEIDEIDDMYDLSRQWECGVGKHSSGDMQLRLPDLAVRATKEPVTDAGNVSGATYQLRIAVETDNEFCTAFGDDTTDITTYIGDLIGKASIVYSRDVKTTLVVGDTQLRTGGSGDPWTVSAGSGTEAAIAEFGTYWHNNYPMATVPRSSAVFLSGKFFNGGIAWIDVLCGDDVFCGSTGSICNGGGDPKPVYANKYAGAYAFNGSFGSVTLTVPDPEATVNNVEYGLPNTGNFWMLLELLHELGHNVGSPHTNCIALSPAEQTAYGVPGRAFVDLCLSGDAFVNACYSGALSAPAEKGSVMSYCHNISSGGFPQSRYLLGKTGEPSEKMLPIFKSGYFGDGGLEGCTANPTITIQSQPVACSEGRTASVAICSGCTYVWQITGGTITSATNIAAITYTPTATNVTLTVTVTKARGCGITASKDFLSTCVPVSAPTNVVATATSTTNVNITWTASVGAASYNVYRSADGSTYAPVGNVIAPTVTFNDSGRTANTAYLYKVRAVSGGESTDSNIDLATTVIFTNDPLAGGTTGIQAVHIIELRTAVNAVRTLASLGAGSYTDPTLTVGVTAVKALHVNDLRSAIDAARSALTLSALSYGETITGSVTKAKATHLTELRSGVK